MQRTDLRVRINTINFHCRKGKNTMQSNNQAHGRLLTYAFGLLFLGSVHYSALAQTISGKEAINDSIVTVDELLKIENRQALLKANRDAVVAGLLPSQEVKATANQPVAIPPATFSVNSIFGSDGVLRANVVYNGNPYEGVRIGAPIGKCLVSGIKTTSVQLTPSKGGSATQCPTGIWTGLNVQITRIDGSEITGGAGQAAPLPAGPLPAGLIGGQFATQQGQAPTNKFIPASDMRAPNPPAEQSVKASAN